MIQANKNVSLKGKGKIDRIRQAQDVAAGELLTKAFEQFGVRHAISFHRSIDAAMDFTDQWDVVGKMVRRKVSSESFHVSSRIPTGKRVSLLRDFRESQAAVISNARCLTEGVDVPNVDAILFADPRKSQVDIVQAVGRALRRDPNNPNKIGYVLLPVVVPDDQTVEQFLESGAFKEIGRVLATLSIHDDRIAEEFRISDSGEIAKGSESRILVMGDMPVSVGEMVSASEFAKQCRAKMWEKVARLNWRPFEEAREFARGLGLKSGADWNNFCIILNKKYKIITTKKVDGILCTLDDNLSLKDIASLSTNIKNIIAINTGVVPGLLNEYTLNNIIIKIIKYIYII